MAKNKTTAETTEAPEAVEGTETDTAAETTEAPKAKVEKAPIDLTAFNAAVKSTLDETEGSDPDEDHLNEIADAYGELEGRAKTAARKQVRELILAELDKDDPAFDTAQVLGKINSKLENFSAAKTSTPKTPKAPVDPTEGHVKRGATLMIALTLHGQNPAEGVAADAQTKIDELYNEAYGSANTYLAWLNEGKEGDEPEVSDLAKDAAKLVAAKKVRASGGGGAAVRTYSGPQRSVAKHIESAFADVESGTHLTVGEIVNKKSAEYGDDKPSAGAVSSALKSAKFSVEGVTPDNESVSPFGATKA